MDDEPMSGSGLGAVDAGSGSEPSRARHRPAEARDHGAWIGPLPQQDAADDAASVTVLERHIAVLTRAIEDQVVPRMLLARRSGPTANPPCARADVAELVRLLLLDEEGAASRYVDGQCAEGLPLERAFLELLSPAARRLGEMWESDDCSFTDVTLALGRLHGILRAQAPEFLRDAVALPLDEAGHPRRVLLVPVPGEQHTFGLAMVSEFFARAGWDVRDAAPANAAALGALVRNEWFAVVGISVGGRDRLTDVAGAIRTIRRCSRNAAAGVMVGGPVFVTNPELAARIGADATASDGKQAVAQAESLVGLLFAQP